MTIDEVINLIINNGIGVACVGYMIYFQFTTMKDISKSMSEMVTSLELIKEEIKDLKSTKTKKKGE